MGLKKIRELKSGYVSEYVKDSQISIDFDLKKAGCIVHFYKDKAACEAGKDPIERGQATWEAKEAEPWEFGYAMIMAEVLDASILA